MLGECRLAYALAGPENAGHERQGDHHCQQGNEVEEDEEGDVVAVSGKVKNKSERKWNRLGKRRRRRNDKPI